MNRSFWKGKKIFLTGHTGFKGSWLSLWLSQLGAEVYGYSLGPCTQPSLFKIANVDKFINSTIGDIRDLTSLKRSLDACSPDIIIHMAAQPLVRKSYADPIETFSTNVMGTANILEAARSCKNLAVLLNVTTDKVYENNEWVWPYRETDRLGGSDPYSNSKSCSELITASYRKSFFSDSTCRVVTARAGNVIGGGDWSEDRLIPDIVRAYSHGGKISIRNPLAIRPWQHVLESLSGYLSLVEHLVSKNNDYLSSWNFGPGTSDFMTVQDLVKCIQEETKMSVSFDLGQSNLHEAQILKLDNSQAREYLGWRNAWDYKKAISHTINWYLEHLNGANPLDLTLEHIKDYEKCL